MCFGIPAVSLFGLMLVGRGIIFQVMSGLYLMVVVLILLLASAAVNAWSLMLNAEPEVMTVSANPKSHKK